MISAIDFIKNLTNKSTLALETERNRLNVEEKCINLLKELVSRQIILSEQARKKKIEKLKNIIDKIYKNYFDRKVLSKELFISLINNNFLINILSFLQYKLNDLNEILINFYIKLLFENDELSKLNEKYEERFFENNQIIYIIDKLIMIFIEILIENNNRNSEFYVFIEEFIAKFTSLLFEKLIKNQDFFKIICQKYENFDINIFELAIYLFLYDNIYKKRETKASIRQNILFCLNLSNIRDKNNYLNLIENLIKFCVKNLSFYYTYYNSLEPKTNNNLNNANIKENEINRILIEDTVSYIKYFIILSHNLTFQKDYFCNYFFNNFLISYVQKDIIELSSNIKNIKATKILEFIYYFISNNTNYDLNETFFYFVFGFNYYGSEVEEISGINEENINNPLSIKNNEKNKNNKIMEDNDIALHIVINDPNEKDTFYSTMHNTNISNTKILKVASNIRTISSNIKISIEKINHFFENILAFFLLILHSKNSKNRILLINIIDNLTLKIPYIVMSELLVPYYLNYLYSNYKSLYDKLCDDLKKTNKPINIIKILKTIYPNKKIPSDDWLSYFISSAEKNKKINTNLINRIDSNIINMITMNNNTEESLLNTTNNFLLINNISNIDYNSSITLTNTSMNYLNTNVNECVNEEEFFNDINNFGYMINNSTINNRNKFMDNLYKLFYNYFSNKFIENLYLTKLLINFCSLPYPVYKGENGIQIFNIYTNIIYADKNKRKIFNISMVGIIYKIKNDLEKLINSKEVKDEEIKRNISLFNEIFKEFLSNLFTKCLIDQMNYGWYKKAIKFDH